MFYVIAPVLNWPFNQEHCAVPICHSAAIRRELLTLNLYLSEFTELCVRLFKVQGTKLTVKQVRKLPCGNDHLISLSSELDSTLLLAELFPLCCLVDKIISFLCHLITSLSVRGRGTEVFNQL